MEKGSSTSGPLWIMVTSVAATEKKLLAFFFSLLDRYWNRIEKLVVRGMELGKSGLKRWRAIYTPAPRLRLFEVELYNIPLGPSSPNPLFDDNAPLLQTIHAKDIKFGTQAPWLAGIHSLRIGYPFTLLDLLNILTMTPLLESLRIDHLASMELGATNTHPVPICLPNLNHVMLWLDFMMSITLLEHITFGRGCSLHIHARGIGQASATWESHSKPFQTLSKYAQDYYNHHTPSAVVIDISESPPSFFFKMRPKNESFLGFAVDIFGPLGEPLAMQKVAVILNALVTPIFNGATELNLQFPAADLNLSTILLSFHAIHMLSTDERTLGYLHKLQGETNNIFLPRLQIVKISTLNTSYFKGIKGDLFPFLCFRRDTGYPVQTLDLTKCNSDISPRLEYLEEMNGMKILWKRWATKEETLEYECGSGHPEMIPF